MKPKYDWLRPRNRWTGELVKLESGEEEWSELDDLPTGWYIAFGEQMVDELNDLLIKYNFTDWYRITQIKEKYGTLRWYDCGFPKSGYDEFRAWLKKYESLSAETCIVCGAPGKMRGSYWIEPRCDEHSNGLPLYEDLDDEEVENDPE